MIARLAAGLTAATLPLVVGVAFAQSGEAAPAVAFFVLTALFVIATFAAFLPILHKLPGIGAPRLTATFTANGSPDLRITIPVRPEHGERARPSVLIRVGLTNHSRGDIAHALLNFCFPVGHGLQICDHRGDPLDRGKSMPPTQEDAPFDYWSIDDLRLTGRNSYLAHFRVRIDKPGEYPLILRLNSHDLYDELVERAVLRVEESAAGDLPVRDALSALIDEGERITRIISSRQMATDVKSVAMTFVVEATSIVTDLNRPDFRQRLDEAAADYSEPKSGDDYFLALVTERVRVLYELRDHPAI
jgi:hypothetical protein